MVADVMGLFASFQIWDCVVSIGEGIPWKHPWERDDRNRCSFREKGGAIPVAPKSASEVQLPGRGLTYGAFEWKIRKRGEECACLASKE